MNPIVIRAWCASCGNVRDYPAPLPPYCATHTTTKLCDLSSPPRAGADIKFSRADTRFLRELRIAAPEAPK